MTSHDLAHPGCAVGLVYHDPGIGQTVSQTLSSGGQQEGCHTAGLTDAPRGDRGRHVAHRVVDTQASSDGAAWNGDTPLQSGMGTHCYYTVWNGDASSSSSRPGLLMYMLIGLRVSSDCRNSS